MPGAYNQYHRLPSSTKAPETLMFLRGRHMSPDATERHCSYVSKYLSRRLWVYERRPSPLSAMVVRLCVLMRNHMHACTCLCSPACAGACGHAGRRGDKRVCFGRCGHVCGRWCVLLSVRLSVRAGVCGRVHCYWLVFKHVTNLLRDH